MFIPTQYLKPLKACAEPDTVADAIGDPQPGTRSHDKLQDYLPPGFVWKSELTGEAIRAFMTDTCPLCGEAKVSKRDPFCQDCMERLSSILANAVTDPLLFIESYHAAIYELQQQAAI